MSWKTWTYGATAFLAAGLTIETVLPPGFALSSCQRSLADNSAPPNTTASNKSNKAISDAASALMRLLKDSSESVRYSAAKALGSIGQDGKAKDAVPVLTIALKDPSE